MEYRARRVYLFVMPFDGFIIGFAAFRLLRPLPEAFVDGLLVAVFTAVGLWMRRNRYPWLVRVDEHGIALRRQGFDEPVSVPWQAVDSASVRRGRLVLRVRLDANPWDRMLAGRVQPDGTVEISQPVWGLQPPFTAGSLAR